MKLRSVVGERLFYVHEANKFRNFAPRRSAGRKANSLLDYFSLKMLLIRLALRLSVVQRTSSD